MVYEGTDLFPNDSKAGWDGHLNEEILDAGVFAWYAKVLLFNGSTEIVKGDILLLR